MTPRQLRDAAVVIAETHLSSTSGRLQQLLTAIKDGALAVRVVKARAAKKPASKAALPPWLPEDVWERFVLHRQQLGAPLTELAAATSIAELDKLRKSGNSPAVVIEQSIQRGWRGVFAIKAGFSTQGKVPTLGRDEVM